MRKIRKHKITWMIIISVFVGILFWVPAPKDLPMHGAFTVLYFDESNQEHKTLYSFVANNHLGTANIFQKFEQNYRIAKIRIKLKPDYFSKVTITEAILLDQNKRQSHNLLFHNPDSRKISGIAEIEEVSPRIFQITPEFLASNLKITFKDLPNIQAKGISLKIETPHTGSLGIWLFREFSWSVAWIPIVLILGVGLVIISLRLPNIRRKIATFDWNQARLKTPFSSSFNQWIQYSIAGILLCWTLYLFAVWWQLPFYADTLWHYQKLLDSNYFELLFSHIWTDAHFTPLHQFILGLLVRFPPFSHEFHIFHFGFTIVTLYLMFIYLKKLGVHTTLRWLALLLFLTIPTIRQTMYWENTNQYWYCGILILIALNLIPSTQNQWNPIKLFLTTVLLIATMNFNELVYAFCAFVMMYWVLIHYKSPRNLATLIIMGTLMLGFILLRNYMVNGNVLQLSHQEEVNRIYGFPQFQENLQQILKYSHPLLLLDRYILTGYLLNHHDLTATGLFILISFYLLQWWIVFYVRIPHRWELLILATGTPLMILLGKGVVEERYLFFTILVNCLVTVLILQWLWSQLGLPKLYAIVTGVLLLAIGNMIPTHHIVHNHWLMDAIQSHQIIQLAKNESTRPLGIVDSHNNYQHRLQPDEYYSAAFTDFYSLNQALNYYKEPLCLYPLSQFIPSSAPAGLDKQALDYLKLNCEWYQERMSCFKYIQEGFWEGRFEAFYGKVNFALNVPESGIDSSQLTTICQ